jgi:hypothetical protein
MEDKIYLKIARTNRGNFKYAITRKKNFKPLDDLAYRDRSYFPTILVGLNIEVPDELFKKAQAEIDIKIKEAEVCNDIKIEPQEQDPLDEIFVDKKDAKSPTLRKPLVSSQPHKEVGT